MKNIVYILLILLFTGCEKVVDLSLNTAAPKLVVDASINWDKGTNGNQQMITLSTTTGYNQKQVPKVFGATVFVTNSAGVVFNFIEKPNTGNYLCINFIPVINEDYTLTVSYKGETYIAKEKLMGITKIIDVEQRNDLGINRDEIGIKVNFQDPPLQDNFFLISYGTTVNSFPQFEVFDDRFFSGNINFGVYSDKDLKVGDQINVSLYGISEMYFNYMKILIGVASGTSGNPFGATPFTTVRGNLINQTTKDNYALGYFRLCETDRLTYTAK